MEVEAPLDGEIPIAIMNLLRDGTLIWRPEIRLGSRVCLGGDPEFQLQKKEKEWNKKNKVSMCPPEVTASTIDGVPSFRYIELFAGIGGFRLALEKHGGKCVFASELTREARDVYASNFGDRPHGDVTEIPCESIPEHEVET